ncbi:hypothetical protein EVG20_g897 [Dentipellis fragilis]|uniref:GAR domain-containing protein n=1 Tax=Dentipellis fragilis TaxID=205917 RepID=A0A4Y9ZBZ7_9AGAM|nr:hypothetical protein EVG20_g897 [Dentipellis fragilis]
MADTPADPPPLVDTEASGTLDTKDLSSLESLLASRSTLYVSTESGEAADHGAEQALESHEVLELQAFSERKEWIVDKIKFLEAMPPVDLFAGVDAIRASAAVVPGLPSRDELQKWLNEHDKIEKETEVFDSGELKKFKQFTKATAKRNLSPEDTDLIELTLTTIYEFDKLLHLLRDRSESLDLLSVRLTWEEQRQAAWTEHRKLTSDLQAFLSTRARWSPSVYEVTNRPDESSSRRGSIMSIASDSSLSSSVGFSRSARFVLAEGLSKDAAQFAGRISSLRHGKISTAGKALDKLIDNSRKPVPEELLDEQDKLEDQGIKELENVGKFVMDVVTQWRKADEFYVETVKDKMSARTVLDEVETARLSHPSARQDTAFMSRIAVITKRLQARKSPLASGSNFPRPRHPAFPHQKESNEVINQLLDSELSTALDQTRQVEKNAQEYHTALEAVTHVDTVRSAAGTLSTQYKSVIDRLDNGVSATDGDGSPPDLSTSACLSPTQHSAFLALLPSLLQEAGVVDEEACRLLPEARAALLKIESIPVDSTFKSDALHAVEELSSLKDSTHAIRETVMVRADLLRDARRLWSSAEAVLRELESIRCAVGEAMLQHRWRQQTTFGHPPTPDSPRSPLVSPVSSASDAMEQLNQLEETLLKEITRGISFLPSSMDPGLRAYMMARCERLAIVLSQTKQMVLLTNHVQQQAQVMDAIRTDVRALKLRFEHLEDGFSAAVDAIMEESNVPESSGETEPSLTHDAQSLRSEAEQFIAELPHRVPFVTPDNIQGGPPAVKRRFSLAADATLDALNPNPQLELPFDVSTLDNAVRTDSNAFSLNLNSSISSLDRKRHLLQVARTARDVDRHANAIVADINAATGALGDLQASLHACSDSTDDPGPLQSLLDDATHLLDTRRPDISQSIISVRKLLPVLEDLCKRHDMSTEKGLLGPRTIRIEEVESRFKAWTQDVSSLKSQIVDTQTAIEQRRQAAAAKEEAEALNSRTPGQAEGNALLDAFELASGSSVTQCNEPLDRIHVLRKRLHSISVDAASRLASPSLPSQAQSAVISSEFDGLSAEVSTLSPSVPGSQADVELQSLLVDMKDTEELLRKLSSLADLTQVVQECDAALSDLLEHIDSYPRVPDGILSSPHVSAEDASPEDQLQARMTFTKELVDRMDGYFLVLSDDARARVERERILQTWSELESMASDRISGHKSRPPSAVSSGRESRVSSKAQRPALRKKSSHYSMLSLGSVSRDPSRVRGPSHPSTSSRRIASHNDNVPQTRPSSKMSMASSTRSVSGPLFSSASSRLHQSTFASRQRTTSMSTGSPVSPTIQSPHVGRTRTRTLTMRTTGSPTLSDASVQSYSYGASRSSVSHSTWGRAPRMSLPTAQRSSTPQVKNQAPKRKPYVANPKNKLDVAVGDIVNNLPVQINITVAEEGWRDQSGKYWIGAEDPKLCFCRILRSQTVMVRVGGGWMELSKFIKTHFADMFRLLPVDTIPAFGSREEKWINSTTLLEAPEIITTPPRPPHTPEPKGPPMPSFMLSSPSGRSPQSIKSTSSPGSPLTPLQFMRRADPEGPGLRPVTPSKSPAFRQRGPIPQTPNRAPVWKPDDNLVRICSIYSNLSDYVPYRAAASRDEAFDDLSVSGNLSWLADLMELEPKCNALSCRRNLTDKAVVVRIYFVSNAQMNCLVPHDFVRVTGIEQHSNAGISYAYVPTACETSLTEPDDVVVCSLHPSNDYKTSVLSGLNPSTILEICSRAISFWQYQIYQEHSFQQAVIRNMNDKNAQLQKQLDNVIREANGEISLLSNKITELHHDLDIERRKVRDLQDAAKERDKEYQKLKTQYDKIKRKTLLAPAHGLEPGIGFNAPGDSNPGRHNDGSNTDRFRSNIGFGGNVTNSIGAVVGGMEATGVQRTPIAARTSIPIAPQGRVWNQGQERNFPQNHHGAGDRSFQTNSVSDRSNSAQEVENMIGSSARNRKRAPSYQRGAWPVNHTERSNQRIFAPTSRRPGGGFKPAGAMPR